MRKTTLILIAVMVILTSLSLVRAASNESGQTNQTNATLPYIDPEILKSFEQNQTWVEILVKYEGDIPVTFENEEEMLPYYRNITPSLFSYIPETEMRIIQAGLSALHPSFTAKITKNGFNKLVNDSRVVRIALIRQLAETGNEPDKIENKTLPYIDPSILQAFENQTWVRVLVRLTDVSNITVEGTKEERRNLSLERNNILKANVQSFLATFPQNEIRNIREHPGEFTSDITKEGLDRLSNDPRVKEIGLAYRDGAWGSNDIQIIENQTENQTETKPPEAEKSKSFFQKIINFFKSLFRWR